MLTHAAPRVFAVSNTLPVKTVKELIAYGKAYPGTLTFAFSGSGGASHFSGELFKTMAGADMPHVPNNTAPRLRALICSAAALV